MSRANVVMSLDVQVPALHSRAVANLVRAIDRLLEVAAQRKKQRRLARSQDRLAAAMRAAFRAQGKLVLKRLAALKAVWPEPATESVRLREGSVPDWEAWFDEAIEETRERFTGPLRRFVPGALAAGAGDLIGDMKIDLAFNLDNPHAVAYLGGPDLKFADDLFDGLSEVSKDDVRRIIQQGVDEGKSYQQVAQQLREKYDSYHDGLIRAESPQEHIRDRAELIATTTMGDAYEAGTKAVAETLKDAGLEMEKSWLTVGDDRVDAACEDNQNAGWIPFDDGFPSGALRPPDHPACRCTALYRRKPSA